MTRTGPATRAAQEPEPEEGGTGVLAVVVTAGNTPFLATTLGGVASQARRPDVVLVVDVASRANGLGDGTPIEEVVEACGLDVATAVRIVRAGEASTFGAAVSLGLAAYGDLVASGNRRRRTRVAAAPEEAAGPERSLLAGAGQVAGPAGALSPITRKERLLAASGQQEHPGRQVWLWLLHDDSAPEDGCLHALLTAATNAPSVGVVGPKQVAWDHPEQLLEVGLRTTASARRDNSIVPGEVDQGQYDDRSDVLAVGAAGALVDRTVWDEVEGIPSWLGPFGDGLELSRAARLRGYRVVVEPQAVLRHRRASYLGLRPARHGQRDEAAVPVTDLPAPDPERSFRERRATQLTLWASFSTRPVPVLLAWFVVLGVGRAVWRLVSKAPALARDELVAACAVAGRAARVRVERQRLARHTQVPRSALSRLYVAPARIRAARRDRVRQQRERLARAKAPSELELRELAGLARTRRRVLVATLLLVLAVTSAGLSHVLMTRSLAGGALVSLGEGWRQTWDAAWSTWVPSADGYEGGPTPLLAVLAVPMAVGALVGLDSGTGIHVLFLAAPPLAALGGWYASGAVTRRVVLRGAASLVWALSPTLLLAVGQGRLAAVLVHLALPWMLLALARAVGADRRDVVLSGLVGAHLLTDRERAELDRFSQDRVEDLAHLDEEAEEAAEREAGTVPEGRQGPARPGGRDREAPEDEDAEETTEDTEEVSEDSRDTKDLAGVADRFSGKVADRLEDVSSAGKVTRSAPSASAAGRDAQEQPAAASAGTRQPQAGSADASLVEHYGPGSAAAAAAAGLLACLIVAAAPATAPLLAVLVLLLSLLSRRGVRLLLTLPPLVVTAAPAWWRAWRLASQDGWGEGMRLLLTDAGAPVGTSPPSGVDLLLGSPGDLDLLVPGGPLAVVSKVLLAAVPAAALAGGVLAGRLGARARAGLLLAAGGLGLATLSTRTVTAVGTGLGTGGSLLVTGWAGTGLSFALAGLLLAGLAAGDAVASAATRGARGRWRWLAGAACLVLLLGPALTGAAWAWQARSGSAEAMALRQAGQQVPLVAAQIQSSPSQGRVLRLAATPDGLGASVWRYPGTQLVDVLPEVLGTELRARAGGAGGHALPAAGAGSDGSAEAAPPAEVELVAQDEADADLVALVARVVAGQDKEAAALLADHGIAVVVLAEDSGEELTAQVRSGLAATPGLDQMAQTESGTAWRVASQYAQQASRLTVVDPDGGVTSLPSARAVSTRVRVPEGQEGRTLVLAERSSPSWTATLDGRPLEPTRVSGETGSWKQAFSLPADGGVLEVRQQAGTVGTVLTYAIWAAWVLTAVAALPVRRGREAV